MTTSTLPTWFTTLRETYQDGIAHAFLLHGTTRDYVPTGSALHPYVQLRSFLLMALQQEVDLIIAFDPAQGVHLPIPAHQERLATMLNTAQTAPSSPILLEWTKGRSAQPNPAMVSLRDVTFVIDWLLRAGLALPAVAPADTQRDTHPPRCRIGIIIDFAQYVVPDGDLAASGKIDTSALTRLILWAQDTHLGEQHQFYLIAETLSDVQSELRRASARWEAVALPLPDAEARHAFIDSSATTIALDLAPDQLALLTRQTGGLTLLQIEDVLLRAARVGTITATMIEERKRAIIAQEFAGVIAVSQPRTTLDDVAGYRYLKEALAQRVVRGWQGGTLRIGGLLLSGPPGTGKTQLAEALAGSSGVAFVVFRLSHILGQYVGNSERNLERAIHAMQSLAPVIVFIDELDQVMQRGSGDGGNQVGQRIFARLLEFMEDPSRRGKILFVAATNRPDLLDAALVSRFDRTIPVLPPTDSDRQAIFALHAERSGLAWNLAADLAQQLISQTHLWVGRNIRDFVQLLAEDVALDPDTSLAEHLQMALAVYQPPLRDTAEMTQLALATVTDTRLVPPQFRQEPETPVQDAPLPFMSGTRRRREERS